MKTLIAYFSWSGNTVQIAEKLAKKTRGDLFRIERAIPYSTDYHTCAYEEAKEESDKNLRPAVKGPLPELAGYDAVMIAFPIWWYTIQNIYSMVERGIESEVIPYCLAHDIGVVPFSPIASGFLSGKLSAATDFSHSDDVRKFVPQLSKENIDANRPILDLIRKYAEQKQATNAQISLAWMLRKYPNVVPIPGSKNLGRILENLGAWNVVLSDEEFRALDEALEAIPVFGHRGFVQFEGAKMSDWGKK